MLYCYLNMQLFVFPLTKNQLRKILDCSDASVGISKKGIVTALVAEGFFGFQGL